MEEEKKQNQEDEVVFSKGEGKVQKKVVIFSKKIDFNALDNWADATKDDIPVVGYISFYRAIGLIDAVQEYMKDHPDFYLYHLDSIFCNFTTHKAIKRFIERQWKTFDLDIDASNHVFWKDGKYKKGIRHYSKKINNKISKCLAKDYANYCPAIDDELPVMTIELVDWVDDDNVSEEVIDNQA